MENEVRLSWGRCRMIERLDNLDKRMYNLNANLSALIHIQKLKSKEEAEGFMRKINHEIADWIKEIREIKFAIHENEVE